MKANLAAAGSAAGLVLLMWLFLYFPTFYIDELSTRFASAGMAGCIIIVAIQSGKLKSRIEVYALALSAILGVAVFAGGLIAYFLR